MTFTFTPQGTGYGFTPLQTGGTAAQIAGSALVAGQLRTSFSQTTPGTPPLELINTSDQLVTSVANKMVKDGTLELGETPVARFFSMKEISKGVKTYKTADIRWLNSQELEPYIKVSSALGTSDTALVVAKDVAHRIKKDMTLQTGSGGLDSTEIIKITGVPAAQSADPYLTGSGTVSFTIARAQNGTTAQVITTTESIYLSPEIKDYGKPDGTLPNIGEGFDEYNSFDTNTTEIITVPMTLGKMASQYNLVGKENTWDFKTRNAMLRFYKHWEFIFWNGRYFRVPNNEAANFGGRVGGIDWMLRDKYPSRTYKRAGATGARGADGTGLPFNFSMRDLRSALQDFAGEYTYGGKKDWTLFVSQDMENHIMDVIQTAAGDKTVAVPYQQNTNSTNNQDLVYGGSVKRIEYRNFNFTLVQVPHLSRNAVAKRSIYSLMTDSIGWMWNEAFQPKVWQNLEQNDQRIFGEKRAVVGGGSLMVRDPLVHSLIIRDSV